MENEQIKFFDTKETTEIQNNDSTQKKPYKKYINFYRIIFQPSFKDINTCNTNILKEIFNELYKIDTFINIDDVKIELIEKTDNYFFGCLHKKSDIDILTEIKSTINGDNIDLDELIFEHITYFYIDYKNMCISIIKTQRIQNSSTNITKLLMRNSEYNFDILPFKKSEKEVKQMTATGLKLSFVDIENDFVLLDDLNKDGCEFSHVNMQLKLKKTNDNFITKIIDKYKNNKMVKKLSISTDSEDIDILKNTFTKQVAINLSKSFKEDLNSIKDALRDELFKIINT